MSMTLSQYGYPDGSHQDISLWDLTIYKDTNSILYNYLLVLSNDWWLKVLWIFKNIFETLHDLNDSDEKTRMLKTASKNSNRVKSYESFKIMQISI